MLDVDGVISPWWDQLQADYGELALYDAHTHVGNDDPDGVKQTPGELLTVLARARARAVVFPMHEPSGYPPPSRGRSPAGSRTARASGTRRPGRGPARGRSAARPASA